MVKIEQVNLIGFIQAKATCSLKGCTGCQDELHANPFACNLAT